MCSLLEHSPTFIHVLPVPSPEPLEHSPTFISSSTMYFWYQVPSQDCVHIRSTELHKKVIPPTLQLSVKCSV